MKGLPYLSFLYLLLTICITSASNFDCTIPSWRLPTTITPQHYLLRIHPDIDGDKFSGSVDIDIVVNKTTDVIILNSKGLKIESVHVTSPKEQLKLKEFQLCGNNDQLIIPMQKNLTVHGEYMVKIKFSGSLTYQSDVYGLYKSYYTGRDYKNKFMAITQFEPAYAREMFPCWDEPIFKAHFTLKIVHDHGLISLSNMELVDSRNLSDGLIEDTFAKSVKMSTYLVALAVCDFAHVSAITPNGVKVSVYAPYNEITTVQFALDVAVRGLDFFEKFFKLKYPLKKLDLISVNNFYGAMENWGLITFQKDHLLLDENTSKVETKTGVAEVVIHELAHQWFGNLVTMKWWDEIWMNEGFARFFEAYTTDKLFSEWNYMDSYIYTLITKILKTDSLAHEHPITREITDPNKEAFERVWLIYDKAAAVIRMVFGLLGEDKFKNALHHYLSTHQYSNVQDNDLWNILNKNIPEINLAQFASSFTHNAGHPLVTLENKNGKLHASQTRFFWSSKQRVAYHSLDSGERISLWMKEQNESKDDEMIFEFFNLVTDGTFTVLLNLTSNFKWYHANDETYGVYRINYDVKNWKALLKQFHEDHTVFSPTDRSGILNDAFTLFLSNMLHSDIALGFIEYLPNENATGPYEVGKHHLDDVQSKLRTQKQRHTSASAHFKMYVQDIFTPIYKKCRIGEVRQNKLIQNSIDSTACQFGVKNCLDDALKMFDSVLNSSVIGISPDQRIIVLKTAVQNDKNGKNWDAVFELYKNSMIQSEKIQLLQVIAATNNHQRIDKLLFMTLKPSSFEIDSMNVIFNEIMSNPGTGTLAWDFFQANYKKICDLVPLKVLANVIRSFGKFNSKSSYKKINDFFVGKQLKPDIRTTVDQMLEEISINIEFLKRNENKMKKYFMTALKKKRK